VVIEPPTVKFAGKFRGDTVPFYLLTWQTTGPVPAAAGKRDDASGPFDLAAEMEIDARSGEIVSLSLVHPTFHDYAYALQISNLVHAPASVVVSRPRNLPAVKVLPTPQRDEVEQAIKGWRLLCGRLEVDPGGETNLSDVDWERSCLYRFTELSSKIPVCRVVFRNGTEFDSFKGTIFYLSCSDRCYGEHWQERPKAEWGKFKGKVSLHWEDLAKGFRQRLISGLGYSESDLSAYEPGPLFKPPEFGTEDVARAMVAWRIWPKRMLRPGEYIWIDETKLGFTAEFDLQTGAVKMFALSDPGLIRLLAKRQGAK
jgi:hypothetical protein